MLSLIGVFLAVVGKGLFENIPTLSAYLTEKGFNIEKHIFFEKLHLSSAADFVWLYVEKQAQTILSLNLTFILLIVQKFNF